MRVFFLFFLSVAGITGVSAVPAGYIVTDLEVTDVDALDTIIQDNFTEMLLDVETEKSMRQLEIDHYKIEKNFLLVLLFLVFFIVSVVIIIKNIMRKHYE